MDREAWWAVHRVAKSWTQLSDFHLRRGERKNLQQSMQPGALAKVC